MASGGILVEWKILIVVNNICLLYSIVTEWSCKFLTSIALTTYGGRGGEKCASAHKGQGLNPGPAVFLEVTCGAI